MDAHEIIGLHLLSKTIVGHGPSTGKLKAVRAGRGWVGQVRGPWQGGWGGDVIKEGMAVKMIN